MVTTFSASLPTQNIPVIKVTDESEKNSMRTHVRTPHRFPTCHHVACVRQQRTVNPVSVHHSVTSGFHEWEYPQTVAFPPGCAQRFVVHTLDRDGRSSWRSRARASTDFVGILLTRSRWRSGPKVVTQRANGTPIGRDESHCMAIL